jgi:hypothetical protein
LYLDDEEEGGRRRLEDGNTESEFSRFSGKGSSDKVLETSSQMMVIIMALTFLGLSGIVLTKSCLAWFP